MKTNTKVAKSAARTHEGAVAKRLTKEQELRRSVMSTLLWENQFYESGEDIAERIKKLAMSVNDDVVADIAREARTKMKLRHMPLFLATILARRSYKGTSALLYDIIQRADELSEFVALYWKDGKTPLSAQVKKGLAKAFTKFNEYALAKYNRDSAVKLRDVLFMVHAKPSDDEQASLWKRLVDNKLATPDTWEVELSASKDKHASWTRLLSENKLGILALLRNLRNMQSAGVSDALIKSALKSANPERALPFRFISAAKYAPKFEPELEELMLKCLAEVPKLSGKTYLLVDGSGSMNDKVSSKSDLTRFDAACAVAILLREICEDVEIAVFSNSPVIVPARRGFALRDMLKTKAQFGGTNTQSAVELANKNGYDRIIVITDEQSQTRIPDPLKETKPYFINVASYKNGVGYDKWTHIDGWSEAVVTYITELESLMYE